MEILVARDNYHTAGLLAEFALALGDGSYPRLVESLAKVKRVILDDWGIADLSSAQGRDLLEVIDDRTGTRSTLVASQLPFENWHAVIKDPTVSDAVLDRLIHTAYPIALQGGMMRKLNSLTVTA